MSKTNKNKDMEFFQNLIDLISDNTFVSCLGRVVKYSEKTHLADIQPLELGESGEKQNNMILGCSVIQQARQQIIPNGLNNNGDPKFKVKKLKSGDTVFIVFADGDLDEFESGDYKPASNRKHSINDGLVIGIL